MEAEKKYEGEKGVKFLKDGVSVLDVSPVLKMRKTDDSVEVDNDIDTYTILYSDFDAMKYYPMCEYCGGEMSDGDCGDYECELKREAEGRIDGDR